MNHEQQRVEFFNAWRKTREQLVAAGVDNRMVTHLDRRVFAAATDIREARRLAVFMRALAQTYAVATKGDVSADAKRSRAAQQLDRCADLREACRAVTVAVTPITSAERRGAE